jgi:hypothetical protein
MTTNKWSVDWLWPQTWTRRSTGGVRHREPWYASRGSAVWEVTLAANARDGRNQAAQQWTQVL